jgi:hypothetical protein
MMTLPNDSSSVCRMILPLSKNQRRFTNVNPVALQENLINHKKLIKENLIAYKLHQSMYIQSTTC